MILLFFAFLCGLVWWYVDKNITDDLSKQSIIPGLKAVLLTFAAILIIFDVAMLVETDRLADVQSRNASCIEYDGSRVYMLDFLTILNGTYLSGTNDSLRLPDGDELIVVEDNTVPAAHITINYSGIADFDHIHIRTEPNNPSVMYILELLGNDGTWDTVYSFSATGSPISNNIALNGTPYVNGTDVRVRINSTDTGNASFHLAVDYLVLSDTATYTAYCPGNEDTELIFIYHMVEIYVLAIMLDTLPYMALLIFLLLAIQVMLLIMRYANGGKGK